MRRMVSLMSLGLLVSAPAFAQQSSVVIPPYNSNAGMVLGPNGTITRTDNSGPSLTPQERAVLEQGEAQDRGQAPATAPVQPQPPFAATAEQSAPAAPAAPEAQGTSAAAQGYVDPKEIERLRIEMAEEAVLNTPYQRGEVVDIAPRWSNPVARDASRAAWLAQWRHKLSEFGVPAHKVDYEARRLPAELFERWASRQVWTRQQLPSAFPAVKPR